MRCNTRIRTGVCVVALMVSTMAAATEPRIEYFKDQEVGVFAATIRLPMQLDPATTTFSCSSEDVQVSQVFVKPPKLAFDSARRGDGIDLSMSPEEQAKLEELHRERRRLQASIVDGNRKRSKLNGQQTLLQIELAKTEEQNEKRSLPRP